MGLMGFEPTLYSLEGCRLIQTRLPDVMIYTGPVLDWSDPQYRRFNSYLNYLLFLTYSKNLFKVESVK